MATNSEAPSARRILGASLVGTAVEFYDFYPTFPKWPAA